MMRSIHNRFTIALSAKAGRAFKISHAFRRFRHRTALPLSVFSGTPFAAIEIKQDDLMPQIGIARNRAAATILGISRMTAANDDLKLVELRKSTGGRDCGYGPGDKLPSGYKVHPSILGQNRSAGIMPTGSKIEIKPCGALEDRYRVPVSR